MVEFAAGIVVGATCSTILIVAVLCLIAWRTEDDKDDQPTAFPRWIVEPHR